MLLCLLGLKVPPGLRPVGLHPQPESSSVAGVWISGWCFQVNGSTRVLLDCLLLSFPGLSHIIETRKVLDLRIDLRPSYFLLPKSGFYSQTSEVIIVDFGSFQVSSFAASAPTRLLLMVDLLGPPVLSCSDGNVSSLLSLLWTGCAGS